MGYSGREVWAEITHILHGPAYGLLAGTALLSLRMVARRFAGNDVERRPSVPLADPRGVWAGATWPDALDVSNELKSDPDPFDAVFRGDKTAEVRSTTDRTFKVGDVIKLREHQR